MNEPIYFSIIIPVFNRPDEVKELLQSLTEQTDKDFEIIIVEDGSSVPCKEEVQAFSCALNVKYFNKENEGPGQTRNFGIKKATGNYFIFFDSDCLIPAHYIGNVRKFLIENYSDCFGGPDRAHPNFTPIQKAISYTMTAFLTTGGIRGGKKKVDVFHPRSFNMGFSKKVSEATKGYAKMRFGEDVDLSLRILEAGFKAVLIPEASVYHKRRTDFRKFFKQIHNSGIARINLYKLHPKSLKLVHAVPAAFVIYTIFSMVLLAFKIWYFAAILFIYLLLIFIDSALQNKSVNVGWLSVQSVIVQHFAYGSGFIKSFWKRIVLGKPEFEAFSKNFYK